MPNDYAWHYRFMDRIAPKKHMMTIYLSETNLESLDGTASIPIRQASLDNFRMGCIASNA